MGLSRPLRALILAYVAVTLSPSYGLTIVSCDNPQFDTANATGSIRFAGFPPPNTIENNTCTLSTAVKEFRTFLPTLSHVEQTFRLNTDPMTDTNLTGLSYWGCMILLEGFDQPPISSMTNGTNTCDGVFSNDCYNAIISTINFSAI
jgi:hypothetical protein